MIEVPDVLAEWVLGLSTAIGSAGFVFLNHRSSKNTKAIQTLCDDTNTKFSEHADKFGQAIKDLGQIVIYRQNCDDKQDLWQSKFDAMMDANRLQHAQMLERMTMMNTTLTEKIEASNSVFEKQFEDLFEKMDDLDNCMRKLQQQKECI